MAVGGVMGLLYDGSEWQTEINESWFVILYYFYIILLCSFIILIGCM